MISAPLPYNEELRLKDLLQYNILDTPDDNTYQDLASLAAQICNCPFAMISFIDDKRQWIKAINLKNVKEVKRENTICGYAILNDGVMVINDISKDHRFLNFPFDTPEFKVGFYAGAPIISIAGYALGTVCVINNQSNYEFTETQKNGLKIIADQVGKLLELRLQNNLILKNTSLLLESEKKITQLTLINHDNERSFIATEMHENFAQTLTGIKFFIESAEQSSNKSQDFLKQSKENISDLIKQLKVFTKLMVPTTIEYDNYVEVINELIILFSKKNELEIILTFSNKFGFLDTKTGLTIYRIIENQLNIAKNTGSKNICIIINKTIDIFIKISYNGNNYLKDAEANNLLFRNTVTRVEILQGKIIEIKNKQDENIVEINIPLEKITPVISIYKT